MPAPIFFPKQDIYGDIHHVTCLGFTFPYFLWIITTHSRGLKSSHFIPVGQIWRIVTSHELSTELDVFNWPFSLQNKQVRVSLMSLLLYWIGACEVQSPWTLKHSIRLQCNTVELFHDDLRPWSGWRDCSGPRLGCQQGKTSWSHGLWAAKSLLFVFLLENWWRINKISPLWIQNSKMKKNPSCLFYSLPNNITLCRLKVS